MRDYFFPLHQIPLVVLLMVGWLWGGSWLLLRSLKKRGYPKRIKLGNCVLIMLLCGFCGVLAAGVTFLLVNSFGGGLAIKAVGAGAGLVMLVVVSLLVVYAMLELSLGKAIKAAALPMVAVMALMGVVGAAAGTPAYFWRHANRKRELCQNRLFYLHRGLLQYQQAYSEPATAVEALLEKNIVGKESVLCPGPEGEAGEYFYFPGRVIGGGEKTEKLLACDVGGNHGGGRNVLFVNGEARWCKDKEFQGLLELPENKDFADALRKTEGG